MCFPSTFFFYVTCSSTAVVTVTGRSAVRGPLEARDHTGSGSHPAFYSKDTGDISWEESGQGL